MTDPTPPNMSVDELLLGLVHYNELTEDSIIIGEAKATLSALLDTFAEKLIGPNELGGYERGVKPVRNNLRADQRARKAELKKEMGL